MKPSRRGSRGRSESGAGRRGGGSTARPKVSKSEPLSDNRISKTAGEPCNSEPKGLGLQGFFYCPNRTMNPLTILAVALLIAPLALYLIVSDYNERNK